MKDEVTHSRASSILQEPISSPVSGGNGCNENSDITFFYNKHEDLGKQKSPMILYDFNMKQV